MKKNLTELAYNKAVEVLDACVRPEGFHASGLPGGYEAVWARDSQSAALGGALVGTRYQGAISASLETIGNAQYEMGQIPNCVGSYNNDRESDVTYNSVDAPLWFIIGHQVYARSYSDQALLEKHKGRVMRAYWWLRAQDPDALGLIAQQPTADWEDAFPHKYGYVLHNHALYYGALRLMGDDERAEEMRAIINGDKRAYSSLWDKKHGYYLPWGWKNHDTIRECETYFDTAANLLAVITGLATPAMAKSILDYIEKNKVARPYPCKAIWPPIKPGDPEWHDYFELCDAREPLHYLNAGIWPFIGGLYVAALVKTGRQKKAAAELELLAEGVMKAIKYPKFPQYLSEVSKSKNIPIEELVKLRQKEFNEWLDGKTGQPKGEPYQAWSAGLYLYAHACVRDKRVHHFDY